MCCPWFDLTPLTILPPPPVLLSALIPTSSHVLRVNCMYECKSVDNSSRRVARVCLILSLPFSRRCFVDRTLRRWKLVFLAACGVLGCPQVLHTIACILRVARSWQERSISPGTHGDGVFFVNATNILMTVYGAVVVTFWWSFRFTGVRPEVRLEGLEV